MSARSGDVVFWAAFGFRDVFCELAARTRFLVELAASAITSLSLVPIALHLVDLAAKLFIFAFEVLNILIRLCQFLPGVFV